MKLSVKFHLLTTFLLVVIAFVLTTFTTVVYRMMKVKNLQYDLMVVQAKTGAATRYVLEIEARSLNLEAFYDTWQEKISDAEDAVYEVQMNKDRRKLPLEINAKINPIDSQWSALNSYFQKMDNHFQTIFENELTPAFKETVARAGVREALFRHPDEPSINILRTELKGVMEETNNLLKENDALGLYVAEASQTLTKYAEHTINTSLLHLLILAAVSILTITIIMVGVTQNISKRVSKSSQMAELLAAKDFTAQIPVSGSTEVRTLMVGLNSTAMQLNDMLVTVKKTASRMLSSGYAISNSATSTAVATNQIDSNINSISKELSLLEESVNHVTDSITEVNAVVETLVAGNTQQTVSIKQNQISTENMAKSLEDINALTAARTHSAQEMQDLLKDGGIKINLTNDLLNQINANLNDVSEVVTIINAIAEQTNLLSMNAAIEAAHAGEAGKGFSVVAEEIRHLAESTSDNAKTISTAIGSIVEKVKAANDSSQEADDAFAKINESTNSIIHSLNEISKSVTSIDEQGKAIAVSTHELSIEAESVGEVCDKLDAQQSALTEEMHNIQNIFTHAVAGIKEIKNGTSEIVLKMREVNENSEAGYHNMTELENMLESFKTTDPAQELLNELGSDTLENNSLIAQAQSASAEEIMAQALKAEQEMLKASQGSQESALKNTVHEEIEFNLDDVEEITF